MRVIASLGSLILLSAWAACCFAAGADDAAKYAFPHTPGAGNLSSVTVRVKVGGDLTVKADAKVTPLKMSVAGEIRYQERLLEAGANIVRSARHYDEATAAITIEKDVIQPVLQPRSRTIVAEARNAKIALFSPSGPLTRDELDLIDVPCNSLLLAKLLPTTAVSKDDTWAPADDALAAMLGLDAIGTSQVECVLKDVVPGKDAQMQLTGEVSGAVDGVATEMELLGKYVYSFEQGRIKSLSLLIKEKRSIGHVSPGLDVVARVEMTLAPLADSAELTDEVARGLTSTPALSADRLIYEQPEYSLVTDRRWHMIEQRPDIAVWRMVDRGELVAQCNMAFRDVPAGKTISLPVFQNEIKKALGKNFQQFVQASQSVNEQGNACLAVIATGEVSGLPIQWNYHLVTDGKKQLTLAFTLESSLESRFAEADQAIVRSIKFLSIPAETAAEPTPATSRK